MGVLRLTAIDVSYNFRSVSYIAQSDLGIFRLPLEFTTFGRFQRTFGRSGPTGSVEQNEYFAIK